MAAEQSREVRVPARNRVVKRSPGKATARSTIAVHRETKDRMKAVMANDQTYDHWINERLLEIERRRDAELDAAAYRRLPEGEPDEWGDPTEHLTAMGAEAMAARAEGWA
jgi:hypothetical protein